LSARYPGKKKGRLTRPEFWEETSKKHDEHKAKSSFVLHRTREKIIVRNVNFK
jgi:hypothetical protein